MSRFYDLLGVSSSASQTDIKKAFRKKALELHPDKGGNAEQFKEINLAYEILSDPEKRKIYDERGEEGLKGQNMSGGFPFDLGNIFSMFMNVRNMVRQTPPTFYVCTVKLEDILCNKNKQLKITRERLCPCVEKCVSCEGKGTKIIRKQFGPFIQQSNVPCPDCGGRCIKEHCTECSRGMVTDTKVLEIQLSRKIKDGEKIVFQKEGNQTYNHEPGDFIVEIKYSKHSIYRVEGSDLFYTHAITLLEALTGYTYILTHPSGEMLDISSEYTTPETIKKMLGKGIEGDLIIDYRIVFPVLSEEQKQNLKSLLQ